MIEQRAGADSNSVYGSRLYRLAQRPAAPAAQSRTMTEEHCELCHAVVPAEHRHLLDLEKRRLVCSCRPCSLLFDGTAGVAQHYRLIPPDVYALPNVEIDEAFWADLAIPVDLAFFFFDTAAGRVVALYPGPMGAAESQLPLSAWSGLTAANPALDSLVPDVQALLVNRTRGARDEWLVPIDLCYSLVGLIRLNWKGLGGGEEVWTALDGFFADIKSRARTLITGSLS